MKGGLIRRLLFRLHWLIMSEETKYAYLWARTEEQLEYQRRNG
ncbi:MAG: hypothetical protein NTX46_05885 [Chloroflexi bacterium]|nr:hypothetical protein [Chloroflexota bacterium]